MELRSGNKKTVGSTQSISTAAKSSSKAINTTKRPISKISAQQKTIKSLQHLLKDDKTQQTTTSGQEIADISKMVNLAMNEILSLRNTFTSFQKFVEQSVTSMHATIKSKSNNFTVITSALQNEIDSIKKVMRIKDKVMENSNVVTMDARFAYILHSQALSLMEYEYVTQIKKLQNRVDEHEASNEQTAEMVNNLATSISTFMNADTNVYNHNVGIED